MQNLLCITFLVICSLNLIISTQWDPSTFGTEVIDDEKVWLVEFYSTMCGGCIEFNPVWEKIEASMKSVATTKVNIDDAGGMALAQALNVLDEGIPNVRMLKSKSINPKGESIVIGN